MKYDYDFKLDCVLKYKKGIRDLEPAGADRYNFLNQVRYWVKLYDDLGPDGLIHEPKVKAWTKEQRFALVAKVLTGNSIKSVAYNAHINVGLLHHWLQKYREKGMNGLECKKGRRKFNTFMPKKNIKLAPTESEEIKLLRERNNYLEAENLYLKKLRALELEKTAKLTKAKKQKSLRPSKKNSTVA